MVRRSSPGVDKNTTCRSVILSFLVYSPLGEWHNDPRWYGIRVLHQRAVDRRLVFLYDNPLVLLW